MLVVTSDLHLTDQSDSANVRESAFSDVYMGKIVSVCEKKRVGEIHLLFLGDTFDLVRTDYWVSAVDRSERPWNGPLDPETATNTNRPGTERHYLRVLKKILSTRSARQLFRTINAIGDQYHRRVPVRVTFVIGNHDRAFHNFPSLLDPVRARIDAKKIRSVTMAHVLAAPEYTTLARHGHEWEENVHGYPFYARVLKKEKGIGRFDPPCYRVQTIGEVITAELVSGFIWRVKSALPRLWPEMRKLHNLGNLLDILYWLEWFTTSHLPRRQKDRLIAAMMESIASVLDTDLAKLWDSLKPDLVVSGDLTDHLSSLLRITKEAAYEDFLKAMPYIRAIERLFDRDRLQEGAATEWAAQKSRNLQYVFYGHSHYAKQVCFSGRLDGSVRQYINSGTFQPVIERARDGSFFTSDRMTMVFLFSAGEDVKYKQKGTVSIDIWNGWRRRVSGH